MMRFRIGALVFGVAAIVTIGVFTPRLSTATDGVEGYCCVCGPCSSGPSRVCVSVLAPGSEATDCARRCGEAGCQFVEVLEGSCALHAGECTPSPAPAASHSVLLGLGVLLIVGGVYLARRGVAG